MARVPPFEAVLLACGVTAAEARPVQAPPVPATAESRPTFRVDSQLVVVDVDMHLSPGEFEAMRTSGQVEIPASVPAPPSGKYQLLVIARHSGSRLTTYTQEIVVP